MDELSQRDSFGITKVMELYPGLKENFDHGNSSSSSARKRSEQSDSSLEKAEKIKELGDESNITSDGLLEGYFVIEKAIDSYDSLYKRRLDKIIRHCHSLLPPKINGGPRRKLSCILCCNSYESTNEIKNKVPHIRCGRTTTKFCVHCKVVLCMKACPCTFGQELVELHAASGEWFIVEGCVKNVN